MADVGPETVTDGPYTHVFGTVDLACPLCHGPIQKADGHSMEQEWLPDGTFHATIVCPVTKKTAVMTATADEADEG